MPRFEYDDEDYAGTDVLNLMDSAGATDSLQASGVTSTDAVTLMQEAEKGADEA